VEDFYKLRKCSHPPRDGGGSSVPSALTASYRAERCTCRRGKGVPAASQAARARSTFSGETVKKQLEILSADERVTKRVVAKRGKRRPKSEAFAGLDAAPSRDASRRCPRSARKPSETLIIA